MKVVVVGNGMAGSRVVEEICARPGRGGLSVTVLGAEPHGAYNRILLSEVLAGRHTADAIALTSPGWARQHGVDLRLATPAVALDPARRTVTAADGSVLGYDTLVLATGSRPWLPPVAGLAGPDGQLVPGAAVFRSLDDCRALMAAAAAARRALVLGGGVLGLEAARGLAGRGLPVSLVHDAGHLMDRQLDRAAGRVLSRTLGRLGVSVRTGARAAAVTTGPDGRLTGLALADGTRLAADLLVVACGVRPEISLAAGAGLATGQGVIVDDTLRSVSHPGIYAVGECAQHNGLVYGLVAPAWEQAAVLAGRLTGTAPDARYTGSRLVTRLKATGIELAAMGEAATEDTAAGEHGDGTEVLHFADPARGTYKKLVIRDGRVVGAILLGDIDTVGTVTQLFDRGAPAPADRVSLLFSASQIGGIGGTAGADDPAATPAAATVCHCNGVPKAAIQASVAAGACSVAEVAAATRATTGCGTCRGAVAALVDWLTAVPQPQEAAS
ncbi:MAG: FAD-dependent oxidoreductase [Gemmatimonadota bacterium]